MFIDKISLKNFRNYEDLNLEFTEGVNIFKGNNAQGKTNILEAIFFCSLGRSHRTSKDKELIKWNEKFFNIHCFVRTGRLDKTIDIRYDSENHKFIEVNKKRLARISEIFGTLNVVMFSPEDLKTVKEAPALRRKFLDMEISKLDKIYFHNLVSYNKIISERNNLLKQKLVDHMVLDIYDEEAIKFGSAVIKRRLAYLDSLNEAGKIIHSEITSSKEQIEFVYKTSIDVNNISESLRQRLLNARSQDIEKGNTSVGPSRDDFGIYINGKDAKVYGSQGQQRTSVLTMKFASLEIIKKETGEYPVLLLDDVLSELDVRRKKYILSSIKGIQTFITMTGYDEDNIKGIDNIKIFEVVSGEIR